MAPIFKTENQMRRYYRSKKKAKTTSKRSYKKKSAEVEAPKSSKEREIEDYGEEETKLRDFDRDMRYGPCSGITRLERWERAEAMGKNPPEDIHQILLQNPRLGCLWQEQAYVYQTKHLKFDGVLVPCQVRVPYFTFNRTYGKRI